MDAKRTGLDEGAAMGGVLNSEMEWPDKGDCPDCLGNGETPDSERCRRCRGRGVVNTSEKPLPLVRIGQGDFVQDTWE